MRQLPAQSPAPADHQHPRATPGSVGSGALDSTVYGTTVTDVRPGNAAAAGTSAKVSREDHTHDFPTGVPVSVGTTNAEGNATTTARRNHVHGIDVPCVRAVWSAVTSITNNSFAAVAFGGTDEYDTDTMHNPSTNNTRITFNTAGVYSVGGWFEMAADVDGNRNISIRKNGTTFLAFHNIVTAVFGAAGSDRLAIATEAKFAATDYVELIAGNNASGATLDVIAGAFWASYRTAG